MHPQNVYNCAECRDQQKIQRGCRSQPLQDGSYAALRPGKSCRVEELNTIAPIVLRALWCIDNSMISIHDMDAWFVQAVQYAQGERAKIENARLKSHG